VAKIYHRIAFSRKKYDTFVRIGFTEILSDLKLLRVNI